MQQRFAILAKRVFPNFSTRLQIRKMAGLPLDVWDAVRGRRDPLVPPHGLRFLAGGARREEVSSDMIALMVKDGLLPEHRFLDMGCGIGYLATLLTKFMTTGSYEGFDVIPTAIEWASSHVTRLFPNFRFQHVDLFSQHYNPLGKTRAEEFVFPYENASFDFALGSSLFTHLLPPAAEHYLLEISRTLNRGGTGFLTVFLINDESIQLIEAGKSLFALKPGPGYWVLDPAFPETAVGLLEEDFRRWCSLAGLEIKRIDRGNWCGRTEFFRGHDHVIIQRRA